MKKPAARKTAAKTIDGFINLAARMGVGADNLLGQGSYTLNALTRNRIQLENMYRGSWIVGAVVDSVAEDMTREGIEIEGSIEPEQIVKLQQALTRKGIWAGLLESIKWSRLYGGSIAVINIEGQDPSTPLNYDTVAKNQFSGIKIYDRWQLIPDVSNIVESGIDAGLPMYYGIIGNLATGTASTVKVHHSRVIRHIGIQLPMWMAVTEQYWGESVIERMYDRLLSFDTATMGAANLIQKAYLRTVKIDKLREVLAAGGKAEENLVTMFHLMRQLQTSEGVTLLDKEDEFNTTSYTFAGLSDIMLQFGQQISGACGIPLVRLFGQSPAGLNSTGESDLRMYYDNVSAQQESRLRDGLFKILNVLYRSLFGAAPPEDFNFDFVPLWQMSQKEQADVASVAANTIAMAFEKGIIDQATALQELHQLSDRTGVFSNISKEAIAEAAIELPPEPVETAPIEAAAQDSVMTRFTNLFAKK